MLSPRSLNDGQLRDFRGPKPYLNILVLICSDHFRAPSFVSIFFIPQSLDRVRRLPPQRGPGSGRGSGSDRGSACGERNGKD